MHAAPAVAWHCPDDLAGERKNKVIFKWNRRHHDDALLELLRDVKLLLLCRGSCPCLLSLSPAAALKLSRRQPQPALLHLQ